jgi:two-component system chemotaxis sensor kinase CheA
VSEELQREAFREEAYELLGELESSLLELESQPGDQQLVNRVFRAMHTIKGSGAMFGFQDIADFTHEVETVADKVRAGEIPVTKELLTLVLSAKDHIQKMLDNSEDGSEHDPDEAGEILQGLINLEYKTPEEAGPSTEEAEQPVPADSDQPQEGGGGFRVTIRPAAEVQNPDEVLEPLLAEMFKLGRMDLVVHTEDAPDLDAGEPGGCHRWWEARLATSAERSSIEDIFFFAEDDLDVAIEAMAAEEAEIAVEPEEDEAPAAPEAAPEPEAQPEPAPEPEAIPAPKPAATAKEPRKEPAASQAKAKEPATATSIRVAADKLDQLVDLVGELVIVQAQISQVVSERSDPLLTTLSEELERLSDELRDSTLGIRMLPIGTTFSKFRRLVRDLSSELGKEIELSTQGAETELDKTVIERLGDPLVHLLRNSIDHGVEPPDEREAKGKDRQGHILLSAEHSGGEVLIRIKDDGQGMDPEKIKEKAVERGVLAPDAEVDSGEVYNLIFHPGFSMAKEITSVSGRGVGMDVVKRAIDSLRGSIDIQSVQGEGSTITVKLPLTLAIIDGLQVRVENEYYVIPLSIVEECVELTRQDVEQANEQRIIRLRGEIVPYIRLREWFHTEGQPPAIEQIVITGVDGGRVGVVVDTVIGEHQTVIKSLSRVYKDVEGISGATIKGDGTMALILDVPKLFRAVLGVKG